MGKHRLFMTRREMRAVLAEQDRRITDLALEADDLAGQLETRTLELDRALAALEAEQNRVTVPQVGVRDTTAIEDQATQPIPVRPLWHALGIQPVTRVEPITPPPTVTIDPTQLPLSALLLTQPRVTVTGGI